jgi:cardiolipin synthase (CMP-forming)
MNIANKISTFRILSVPFFIACLIYYTPGKEHIRYLALGIFILAAISDGLDGYIARKGKMQSNAGQILDPLGDKLLLMSAFIFLSPFCRLELTFPLWVSFIVISRDLILIMGAVVIYMVKQKMDVHPTKWGKLTTTFQMLSVICVLLQSHWLAILAWWPALIFTLISGFDYIKIGFKVLYANDNHRPAN